MQVSQQLYEKGMQPADIPISLGPLELMIVMHAKLILELCNYLCRQNEIVLIDFKAVSITEALESANTALERIENRFSEH